ncbi:MAG: hypothetical protein C4523_11395 [Myxococcales bacterium]|nr:MAG: hypothetical protein C4523_11395 [Myxococcales bacterium]
MPRSDVSGEFYFRLEIPFLAGIYLAVNAIRDSYLVVDGPMCAFYKIDQLQSNHDIHAELARLARPHRIVHTDLSVNRAVMGEERSLVTQLRAIDAVGDAGVIFVTGQSSAILIGRDQDRLIEGFTSSSGAPVIVLRSRTLSGDWLDGWSQLLTAAAQFVPLAERGESEKPRVGIVGYLYSRHEGDARGDVEELKRLASVLGAEPVSVWLSGQTWAELGEIGKADLLVALPHARPAAQALAKRTGAAVVELPLPFSFEESANFVRGLAAALGRPEAAEAVIAAELDGPSETVLFLAERHLMGRAWTVVADPYYLKGWAELIADCGGEIRALVAPSRPHHLDPSLVRASNGEECQVAFGSEPDWRRCLEFRGESSATIFVANGYCINFARRPDVVFFEWGYPCYTRHPAVLTPSLGFRGQAELVGRIAELIFRQSLLASSDDGKQR